MTQMAYVANLFIAAERHKPMKAVKQVVAVADRGFEGCTHGRQGSKRQILIVDRETLAEFGLPPGVVRENITTVGLNVAEFKAGQRLTIGDAVLEVTIPCEPCSRMDEIRMGLQDALRNRRGVLCRVIEGGRISQGDAVDVNDVAAGVVGQFEF
jgi:MOSC domain-containing protein YiiM